MSDRPAVTRPTSLADARELLDRQTDGDWELRESQLTGKWRIRNASYRVSLIPNPKIDDAVRSLVHELAVIRADNSWVVAANDHYVLLMHDLHPTLKRPRQIMDLLKLSPVSSSGLPLKSLRDFAVEQCGYVWDRNMKLQPSRKKNAQPEN